jgi:hypothetical protein
MVEGGETIGILGPDLRLIRVGSKEHVVTPAGASLCSGHTDWRSGAARLDMSDVDDLARIALHEGLTLVGYACPASGQLLAVDVEAKQTGRSGDICL